MVSGVGAVKTHTLNIYREQELELLRMTPQIYQRICHLVDTPRGGELLS